ncbi:hypothetical protein ICR95_07740 [Priestia megaterium]|uniref:hypothetical protein n=1 Tax=Priestia TaxID=2800373 RepID=UPI00196AE777|nr:MULTISPECIES: hypothetical protein [Priestia]MED3821998.1 hypothetical protein [Priestia aryabhattai]QSF34707.1 hypothetical protein ICR95_07740 [Priestia megaterium]
MVQASVYKNIQNSNSKGKDNKKTKAYELNLNESEVGTLLFVISKVLKVLLEKQMRLVIKKIG